MANFKLTQTGEQIQEDLDLLDSNTATQGQVLTANGAGGASWQNASSGSGASVGGGYTFIFDTDMAAPVVYVLCGKVSRAAYGQTSIEEWFGLHIL